LQVHELSLVLQDHLVILSNKYRGLYAFLRS
jgi:hypothetical protein